MIHAFFIENSAILLLAACLTGCAGADAGPATAPVKGTVTLDGQPVANATVAFTPADSTTAAPAQAASDDAGNFEVTSMFEQGKVTKPGMLPGSYKISVTKLEGPPPDAQLTRAPKNVLPARYADPATSGLSAAVAAGTENTVPIELTK
jgi:hypothetical protein